LRILRFTTFLAGHGLLGYLSQPAAGADSGFEALALRKRLIVELAGKSKALCAEKVLACGNLGDRIIR
jgi:hypothetical protein